MQVLTNGEHQDNEDGDCSKSAPRRFRGATAAIGRIRLWPRLACPSLWHFM